MDTARRIHIAVGRADDVGIAGNDRSLSGPDRIGSTDPANDLDEERLDAKVGVEVVDEFIQRCCKSRFTGAVVGVRLAEPKADTATRTTRSRQSAHHSVVERPALHPIGNHGAALSTRHEADRDALRLEHVRQGAEVACQVSAGTVE